MNTIKLPRTSTTIGEISSIGTNKYSKWKDKLLEITKYKYDDIGNLIQKYTKNKKNGYREKITYEYSVIKLKDF